jgi:hypothetical protein
VEQALHAACSHVFLATLGKDYSHMSADLNFHLSRARRERDLAYRSANPQASDAHMKMSVLHLKRALEIQGAVVAHLRFHG